MPLPQMNLPENEEGMLVCSRKDQEHSPDSELDKCQACQQEVWVSASGREALGKHSNLHIRCVDCAVKEAGDQPMAGHGFLPGAIESIAEELGLPLPLVEEFLRQYQDMPISESLIEKPSEGIEAEK